MLGSHGMIVPTARMPCVVGITYHLADFATGSITRIVLLAADNVMNTHVHVALLQIGNPGQVITLHVMDDVEFLTVAGRAPLGTRAGPHPNGRTVISTGKTVRNEGRS